MGTVVMYSSVSADGCVAEEDDQPGSLFDWLSNGDVLLDSRHASTQARRLGPRRAGAGGRTGRRSADGRRAPVVSGAGKRYFGSVYAQHLLEDPDVVIQDRRALHLRYRVRR